MIRDQLIHALHCREPKGLGPCDCNPIPPTEPFGPGPRFIVLPGEGSEADRAAKAKGEIQEALRGVCLAIDAAAAAEFVTSFQLGLGPTGRQIVAHLSLAKHF